MIQRLFDAIESSDIEQLIRDGVVESKTLEYKRELPGTTDDAKREFLADISSFANAAGGDIIFGVEAAVDGNGNRTGAPKTVCPILNVTPDEAKLRVEEVIRNGIAPRLKVQIREIAGRGGDGAGYVLLVRVPRSFASPHMVTFKGSSRFYSRNSAGKYQLDVGELRSAFVHSEELPERIRRFRQDRLAKIVAGETPVPMASDALVVLHLVPVESFHSNEQVDILALRTGRPYLPPLGGGGGSIRLNLDGFVNYSGNLGDEPKFAYAQMFRHGAIEAVDATLLHPDRPGGGQLIPSEQFERDLLSSYTQYATVYRELGITPPVVAMLSLLRVRGYYMYAGPARHADFIDRDNLLMPDILIEDLTAPADQVLRPAIDLTWQSCGFVGSLNYDERGKWRPR